MAGWLDGWMDGWGWLVINIKVVYKLVYLKKGKSRQLIKLIIVGHTKKDKCNWVSQSSLGSVCGGTKVKLKLKLKLNMIFFYISTSTTHTRLLPTYSICLSSYSDSNQSYQIPFNVLFNVDETSIERYNFDLLLTKYCYWVRRL